MPRTACVLFCSWSSGRTTRVFFLFFFLHNVVYSIMFSYKVTFWVQSYPILMQHIYSPMSDIPTPAVELEAVSANLYLLSP